MLPRWSSATPSRARSALRLAAFVFPLGAGVVLACTGTEVLPSGGASGASLDGASGASEDDANVGHGDADAASNADTGTDVDSGNGNARNLVNHGDFEVAACAGWKVNAATATTVDGGLDGGSACMVCAVGGTSVYSIFQAFAFDSLPTPIAGDYIASAYLRLPEDGDASAAAYLSAKVYPGDGTNYGGETKLPLPGIVNWTQRFASVTFDGGYVDVSTGGLEIAILGRDADHGCFLVDRVTFTKAD